MSYYSHKRGAVLILVGVMTMLGLHGGAWRVYHLVRAFTGW